MNYVFKKVQEKEQIMNKTEQFIERNHLASTSMLCATIYLSIRNLCREIRGEGRANRAQTEREGRANRAQTEREGRAYRAQTEREGRANRAAIAEIGRNQTFVNIAENTMANGTNVNVYL